MADAKARGEEQKKEDEKALVLEILGIVFAFIPFLDEFGPELDFLVSDFYTSAFGLSKRQADFKFSNSNSIRLLAV